MQLAVLQDNLKDAVNTVSRFIETRPTMLVTANVLLETGDARLGVAAANLTEGATARVWVGCKVDSEGAITLPARTLKGFVDKLPQARIDMALDQPTATMKLTCGTSRSNIKGIDADEFPPLPDIEPQYFVDAAALKRAIQQTAYAAASEDNRPILTGVYIASAGETMTFAAADGYRLASVVIPAPGVGEFTAVVPAKTLMNIARCIGDEREVGLAVSDERMAFSLTNAEFTAMTLDGRFPDFAAIVPRTKNTAVMVYTSDLASAVDQAEVFARDNANSIKLHIEADRLIPGAGTISITGRSAERGEAHSAVEASIEGEDVEISLNFKYLEDVVKATMSERLVMDLNGGSNPVVLRPDEGEQITCVLMPMQLAR